MKNCFSRRLYIEGITRVRTPGIIAAVFTVIYAIFAPLTTLMSLFMTEESVSSMSISVINGIGLTQHLVVLLIAGPWLAVTSFRFLNKRHSSDFYHALPYTRTSIFFSFLLGILTWICATALVSTLLRALLYSLIPSTVVKLGAGLLGTLSYVIGVMVLLGYALLALSLSGTRFANIAVFLILYGLPRFFTGNLCSIIGTMAPIIDVTYPPYAIFSGEYALVPLLFENSSSFTVSISNLYVHPVVMIFHFFFALGLFVLGAYAFSKRPSETAANPTVSRKLQHLWRILAASPIAVFGALISIELIYEGRDDLFVSVIAAILFFCSVMVFAAGFYVLYEVFSSGKIRKFGGIALRFLYVFIPAIAFVILAVVGRAAAVAEKIAPEDIESVSFSEEYYFYGLSWEYLATGDMSISDPEILALVYQTYSENLAAVKDGSYSDKYGSYGGANNYTSTSVQITTKNGKTRGYILSFEEKDLTYINEKKLEIKEFLDAYLSMPDQSSVSYCHVNGVYTTDAGFYSAFLSAYESLSEEDKIAFKEGYLGEPVFEIYVSGQHRPTGHTFSGTYYIPTTMTELINYIRQFISEKEWQGYEDDFTTKIEAAQFLFSDIYAETHQVEYYNIDALIVSGNKTRELYFYQNYLDEWEDVLYEEGLAILSQATAQENGNYTSPHYAVLSIDYSIDDSYESFTIVIALTEEEVAGFFLFDE